MTNSSQATSGSVIVVAGDNYQPISVYYNLSNLTPNSVGGLHIHTGSGPGVCTNASAVGGHYWIPTPTITSDPWNTTWTSDSTGRAVGNFTVSTGVGYSGNVWHAIVVHTSSGARVGCGVLQETITSSLAVMFDTPTLNVSVCGMVNQTLNASVQYLDPPAPKGNTVTTAQTWTRPALTMSNADASTMYTVLFMDQVSWLTSPFSLRTLLI